MHLQPAWLELEPFKGSVLPEIQDGALTWRVLMLIVSIRLAGALHQNVPVWPHPVAQAF